MNASLGRALTIAGIVAAGSAHAQPAPLHWRIGGSAPAEYSMTASGEAAYEGNYGARIQLTGRVPGQSAFGTLAQSMWADPWRGKRISMKSWIRTEEAKSGQMWLRIDGPEGSLSMDNMDGREIKGTTGWSLYEIVMDVPAEAIVLVYGVFLVGGGRVDFDSITFAEAAPGAEVTTRYFFHPKTTPNEPPPPTPNPLGPANLDFEQAP